MSIDTHIEAFNDPDDAIAKAAVAALAAMDDEAPVEEALVTVLRDDTSYSLQQQAYAVATLSRMRLRPSKPHLINAIAGAFFRTLQAIDFKGDFADPAGTLMLTVMMDTVNESQTGLFNQAMLTGLAHPHPEVHKWALLLLEIDAGTTSLIIQAFADDNISLSVKKYLMSKLIQLDYQVIDTLIASLKNGSSQVRYWIIRTLAHMHDPAVVPALIPLLHDEDGDVVREAAATLTQINNSEARTALDSWNKSS